MQERSTVLAILAHLGLPTQRPPLARARDPAQIAFGFEEAPPRQRARSPARERAVRAEVRPSVEAGHEGAPEAWNHLRDRLHRMRRNVYAKRPFGGAEQVIRYLGRYTHRVGLSNPRLVTMDEREVTFRTKDGKTVTLLPDAFLGQFLQRVLPDGFVKIRHVGLMAASHATTRLEVARVLLVDGACRSA